MLRIAVARSNVCLEQGLRGGLRRQWQPQRIQQSLTSVRRYADDKQQASVAGVPTGPIAATATTNPAKDATPISATTTPTAAIQPPGGSTTSTPPKRPRRRFRNFLFSLIVLSTLGYAGSVYYSLVNDNFHDFFTEYVPFAEDAVAYFEEREFRRRFPSTGRDGPTGGKLYPQRTGEQKVTIGRQSGLTAKVAEKESENAGTDLASRGKHVSAKGDNQVGAAAKGAAESKDAAPKTQAKAPDVKATPKQESAKDTGSGATKPAGLDNAAASTPKAEETKAPAPAIEPVDHLKVPEASEPAVQSLVAFVNRLITVINASPDMVKHRVAFAQEEIDKIIAGVSELKARASHDAEDKVHKAHAEFEEAAQELVKRVEREMQDQEMKWRDEYEAEREKLSQSYQQKLALELDAARKVAEQKTQNSLLEQEIVLQKQFMDSVQHSVETEREGRLSKLDELSSSVSELQDLTSQWNEVVDATLATQHLQVALEAVRAKVMDSETPTPFLNELVALKETSSNSSVVSAAIASIPPLAYQRGIPTPAQLIDRFRRVASEVRKASLLPEDAGVASHAASAVLSRLMFAKKADRGLPAGEDVEATLARTEVLLEEGDLDSAAREMNALKGWAGVLSKDWVAETRRVLEVRQAVEVMAAEARLQSLLVD